jgi:flagellar biosynthesis/type III secretory pathway protein FliH
MPITESILDHEVLGPVFKKGLQEGRQEGLQQGLQQGELTVIRRQIAKRFGAIPDWFEERLARCSVSDLEELSERVLDARSLEDLVK